MKRIHFDELSRKKEGLFVGFSVLGAILAILKLTYDLRSNWIFAIIILATLVPVWRYLKLIYHPNYITWNKHRLTVKLDGSRSRGILFKKIKAIDIDDTRLEILDKEGEVLSFDLKAIDRRDVKTIQEIFIKKDLPMNV